jgi:hypothetical protein
MAHCSEPKQMALDMAHCSEPKQMALDMAHCSEPKQMALDMAHCRETQASLSFSLNIFHMEEYFELAFWFFKAYISPYVLLFFVITIFVKNLRGSYASSWTADEILFDFRQDH